MELIARARRPLADKALLGLGLACALVLIVVHIADALVAYAAIPRFIEGADPLSSGGAASVARAAGVQTSGRFYPS